MHYKVRKILCTTALALILSTASGTSVWAQESSTSADNIGTQPEISNEEIPDEISLFGDDDNSGVITPQVKKVSDENPLLGNNPKIISPAEQLPSSEMEDEAPITIPASANNNVEAQNPLNNSYVDDIDDDVFNKMSGLEKETAVLNLELRREKVKNDIESMKALRAKAEEEEKVRKGAEARRQEEERVERQKKLLQEQQKLKNLEIKYEQLRQEKLLRDYKNKMLEQEQVWIEGNAVIYQEIEDMKKERQKLINDFKGRFTQLTKLSDQVTSEVIKVRDSYAKTISDLQTQISILRARLEANEKTNPFADSTSSSLMSTEEAPVRLSDLYVIMEIRGKGDNLSAKLINDTGSPFMARVGTALQTGHVIDEITPTYIRADKDGNKDYLYFSAGGILDKEPISNEELKVKVSEQPVAPPTRNVMTSQGIPGLASEMTIR